MGKLVKAIGPILIICGSSFYSPDQHHNNQTPRSTRQQLRTNADKGTPRKRREINRGKPYEQIAEREKVGGGHNG